MAVGPRDRAIIAGQLGRKPHDLTGVAARCPFDYPAVIETAPVLSGGEPNPTLLYLTCPTFAAAVSRAEAGGGVRALKAAYADDPRLRTTLDDVAHAYRERRAALYAGAGGAPEAAPRAAQLAGGAPAASHARPRPDPRLDAGIGGPESPAVAACLHAYAAALLAVTSGWLGGEDAILAMRAGEAWERFLPAVDTSWCKDGRCARWAAGRRAAIDLGTISVRLLVADLVEGRPVTVVRRAEVTRLGEGLEPGGSLKEAARRRTAEVVARFALEAQADGAETVILAGTSATREASDGMEFVNTLGAEHGLDAVVLTGEREAELAYLGAGLDIGGDPVVLDVGGGSTELTARPGGGGVVPVSLKLGASRATEAWVRSDPPTAAELTAIREEAGRMFAEVRPRYGAAPGAGPEAGAGAPAARRLVGVAGTVTTLAALDAGLERYDPDVIHLRALTLESVRSLVARLAAMTIQERAELPCVQVGRAPVIVGGAVIVMAALETLGYGELIVSERDLLDGLVMSGV